MHPSRFIPAFRLRAIADVAAGRLVTASAKALVNRINGVGP